MHVREIMLTANADAPKARLGVDEIIAAGRRRRRRAFVHRVGGAGAAGVAVVTAGVLVAVNLAVPRGQAPSDPVPPAAEPPAPTAPAPSPPFTFTFGGYQVDNYRILPPDVVTPDYQVASVLRDSKDAAGKVTVQFPGRLTVYQPKRFDPEPSRGGTKVTVQGREGYQTETIEDPSLLVRAPGGQMVNIGGDKYTSRRLTWQYAPDSWAVLENEPDPEPGNDLPPGDLLKLAERFTVANGGPVAAKAPFRAGYLPAGFTLQYVTGQSLTAENRRSVSLVYAKPQPPAGPLRRPHDLAHDQKVTSVVVTVSWLDKPPRDATKRTSRCNPGDATCVTTLAGGQFSVLVQDPSLVLSDNELLKVSDALTFANIKDTATWFPVS